MELIIKVPKGTDLERITRFFSMFRFSKLSIRQRGETEGNIAIQDSDSSAYYVTVILGLDGLVEADFDSFLENGRCSLLFFNDHAPDSVEPKVIYTTDHSSKANSRLERFKQLKPAGFTGAAVISEGDSVNSKVSLNDMSKQVLEKIRSAVNSTQANVIIASYDFGNTARKKAQISNVIDMVRQNRCHVLILKT